jgi:hypothetical protein
MRQLCNRLSFDQWLTSARRKDGVYDVLPTQRDFAMSVVGSARMSLHLQPEREHAPRIHLLVWCKQQGVGGQRPSRLGAACRLSLSCRQLNAISEGAVRYYDLPAVDGLGVLLGVVVSQCDAFRCDSCAIVCLLTSG